MPLYNEETITETTSKTLYEYAYDVQIQNPVNETPKVTFKTGIVERNNSDGSEKLLRFRRAIEETYSSNETFNLLNPADGSVVGSMDYDTVFAAMYSLFFHVATKADSQE